MPATCVPWYTPRGNMGLSKHDHLVFAHFYPLNQNLALRTGWGGGRAFAQHALTMRLKRMPADKFPAKGER